MSTKNHKHAAEPVDDVVAPVVEPTPEAVAVAPAPVVEPAELARRQAGIESV